MAMVSAHLEQRRCNDRPCAVMQTLSSIKRMQTNLRRNYQRLHGPKWFPYIPVTVLVLIAGSWLLYSTLGQQEPALFQQIKNGEFTLKPKLLPAAVIGGGLLILSIGLALRSRLAWALTTFLICTALIVGYFANYQWPATLPAYLLVVSVSLIVTWRSFTLASLAATTLFSISLIAMLFSYATYGSLYLGGDFKPEITDVITALYYSTVTMSTVGYGDIIPQTTEAKLFAMSLIVFGVAVFATSLTALVTPLLSKSMDHIVNRKGNRMKREDHFVVLGNSTLANNTYNELLERGQPVTRILRQAPEDEISKDDDIVIGDSGNLETLRAAGCEKANAVLAMFEDDAENAFAILAVRELKSTGRTVAAVNNLENLGRIKLVKPDVVIAPQILGGELAAMLACGEEVTPDFVMNRIIHATEVGD